MKTLQKEPENDKQRHRNIKMKPRKARANVKSTS